MERSPAGGEQHVVDAEAGQRDGADVLAAIRLMKADLSVQLKELASSNQEIEDSINVFSERLTEAEIRIGKAEDDITALTGKEQQLEKTVRELTQKLDNLENRSRRSNLRLIGLQEKSEGGDAAAFLQTWLPEVLGTDTFPNPVVIENAHRLPNGPPRALIMKFLNYQDKVRVMRAARQKGKVMYQERQVMFFPDLSVEVQKQRRQYNDVKRKLHELNLDFGLIFPAKMRIMHEGRRHLFNTPGEVEAFIQRLHLENDE